MNYTSDAVYPSALSVVSIKETEESTGYAGTIVRQFIVSPELQAMDFAFSEKLKLAGVSMPDHWATNFTEEVVRRYNMHDELNRRLYAAEWRDGMLEQLLAVVSVVLIFVLVKGWF